MLNCWTLAVGLAVVMVAPASAQLKPSPLPEIFQSYNDCFSATPSTGLAPEALENLGWGRADTNGSDLIVFGHKDRKSLIMLSAEKGAGICIVISKLEDTKVFDSFLSAFGGKLPKPDKEGNISFSAEGRPVQLSRTGSRKAPAMRAIIMTPKEKN